MNALPRENYRRIARGYEPREPAALPEQALYVLRSFWIAIKVLWWRVRPDKVHDEGQEKKGTKV